MSPLSTWMNLGIRCSSVFLASIIALPWLCSCLMYDGHLIKIFVLIFLHIDPLMRQLFNSQEEDWVASLVLWRPVQLSMSQPLVPWCSALILSPKHPSMGRKMRAKLAGESPCLKIFNGSSLWWLDLDFFLSQFLLFVSGMKGNWMSFGKVIGRCILFDSFSQEKVPNKYFLCCKLFELEWMY